MRHTVGRQVLRRVGVVLLAASLLAAWPQPTEAYSILAHEAIIDAAWNVGLRALLLQRFPDATKEQLKDAHAYAYGGAIIQDLGYYPHGSHFFSDLTHYCRSGDFILALLRDSKDLNGYAFALGALSHYAADNDGHALGTNLSVPILYPKLEKKYGNVVTYEQNPLAHVKTEFGFDVLEVAKQRYAPDSYHDFIGFEVDAPLLEQAFQETYGLDLKVALPDEEKALGSYRRSVSKLIPKATRIAWTLKQSDIQKDQPSMTKRKFLYNLSRASYEKNWGKDYQKPTIFERFIALLVRILPKFGPLKVLQLRTPTPATETKFEDSFNHALDRYKAALREVRDGQPPDVPNDNFDTGKPDPPGVYFMNDDVHAQLVEELAKTNFKGMSPALRAELTQFYSDPNAPYATKRKPKEWAKLQAALLLLKQAPASPVEAQTLPAYGGVPSAPLE
jgi:zinc dependent phospholipase C